MLLPFLICSIKGLQLKRPVEVQSALLRRYFLELTQVEKLIFV